MGSGRNNDCESYSILVLVATLALASSRALNSHDRQVLEARIEDVRTSARRLAETHCLNLDQSSLGMRVSGLSQTDACDVIATDHVLNTRCNLQNLETIPDSMHNHAKLRLMYRKVWSLQQQLKSPSLCTSPVFAQCCELLADWSHCDASCRSEARVCRGEADNLLRHTHSLLTFIRQHVTGTSEENITFSANTRKHEVRECMLGFLHRVTTQMDNFAQAV